MAFMKGSFMVKRPYRDIGLLAVIYEPDGERVQEMDCSRGKSNTSQLGFIGQTMKIPILCGWLIKLPLLNQMIYMLFIQVFPSVA